MDKKIIDRIMSRAIEISQACPDDCRDFRIMTSPMRKDVLLLRWTRINIDNIDRPVQCFHYECFEPDGSPQNCSVYYSNQEEANTFFASLTELYQQQFAIDHTL